MLIKLSCIKQALKNWYASWTMSAEEAYLAGSADIYELESRMRNLALDDWKVNTR